MAECSACKADISLEIAMAIAEWEIGRLRREMLRLDGLMHEYRRVREWQDAFR